MKCIRNGCHSKRIVTFRQLNLLSTCPLVMAASCLPSLISLSPTVFTIKNGKSVLRSAVVELRIELEVFARRQAELQFARVSR